MQCRATLCLHVREVRFRGGLVSPRTYCGTCLRVRRVRLKVDAFAVLTELAVVYELSLAQLDKLEAAVSALTCSGLASASQRCAHAITAYPCRRLHY